MKMPSSNTMGGVQVLAASHDAIVVASSFGRLFISDVCTDVTRVCGAAILDSTACKVAAITLDKQVIVLSRDRQSSKSWSEDARQIELQTSPEGLPIRCWRSLKDFLSLLQKRPTAVSFTPTGDEVVVADAFGDVYKFGSKGSVNTRDDDVQDRHIILGHLSTVTDVALRGGRLASVDRDDKLRVSQFPDSFVIESFGLGHEEFVTCVEWVDDERLLSGSGDGTVRLWSAESGELLSTLLLAGTPKRDHVDAKGPVVPVITCVRVDPVHCGMAVVACHGSLSLSLVDVSQGRVKLETTFAVTDIGVVSGIAFDSKGVLWVSGLESESVVSFVLEKDGASWNLQRKESALCMGRVEKESSSETDKAKEWEMRYEWLNGRRKKEMVDDWKGKKRRRTDM